jgi:ech hydrogenase subunit A
MTNVLVGLAVLFPVAAGLICLGIKHPKARAGVVITAAVVLVATAILFLTGVGLPLEYTPSSGFWHWAILSLNYGVIAFFIAMAARDMRQRGLSPHNILPIVMALAAGIPLALFEFVWAPHAAESVRPAFYIDHLSVTMLLVISIIGSLITVYAIRYMKDHEAHRHHSGELTGTNQPRFFFFMLLFLGAMNALVFTNDLLWLAFFWEVTTLCCWGLIRHDGTPLARSNALRALWMCLIGSVGLTVAIILLWSGPLQSLSLLSLTRSSALIYPSLLVPLAMLFLASFTKSAQVPFQGWLLGAMVAPTPVSALLHSSTMVNIGVYFLLRLAPSFQGTVLSIFLAVFGGFVFLVASLLAISQSNAKKVLAYSTVANLGLIVLCAGLNTPLAIACGIMLLIFHAVSKALLFMSTGTIEHYIWSRDIEDMEGMAHKLPVLAGITITGMLSMIAAPFGVVVAKWGAIEATAGINLWSSLVLIMLVIGSSATTVFWAKWVGRLLCHAPVPGGVKREPIIPFYHGVLLVLIGIAVAFSFLVAPVYNTLVAPGLAEAGYSATAFTTGTWFLKSSLGIFATWPLLVIIALAIIVPTIVVKVKADATRAAYMCGENAEMGADEFTAVRDLRTELKTGGFYIEGILGEGALNRYILPIGIVFLVALLSLALI